MARRKFVAINGEGRRKKGAEEKGKRARFQMREAMDLDPKMSIFLNQKEIDAYLVKYGIRQPSNV